jgi:hypothetical protein
MTEKPEVHELVGGEIVVWDDNGVIMLKVCNEYKDPVELNEEEALELADLLVPLAKQRTS